MMCSSMAALRPHTSATPLNGPVFYEVPCPVAPPPPSTHRLPGCTPGLAFHSSNGSVRTPPCGRYIQDDFLPAGDIDSLLDMVERGFVYSTVPGGPSILDLNSGLLRDSHGMMDVYSGRNKRVPGAPKLGRRKTRVGRPRPGHNSSSAPSTAATASAGVSGKAAFQPLTFTAAELQLYKQTFDRIRDKIMQVFGLQELWFTAPTFVARIMGDRGYGLRPELVVRTWPPQIGEKDEQGIEIEQAWRSSGPHDEYWHPHADQANTEHYHWSGLLYLSTQLEGPEERDGDFTHGTFAFLEHRNGTRNQELQLTSDLGSPSSWADEHSVSPRAGRYTHCTHFTYVPRAYRPAPWPCLCTR